MKWTLISDDLSGACETGSAINQELNPTTDSLRSFLSVDLFSTEKPSSFETISIIDLNIRDSTSEEARVLFLDFLKILTEKNPQSINFFKVDSLLRGNIAVQVTVLAQKSPLIFIPAVPSLDRIVRNGQVYIQGVALRETNLWSGEVRSAPDEIGELFPSIKAIYGEFQSVPEVENILKTLSPGEIFIPDIKNYDQLAQIAEILSRFPGVISLGSAEFAVAHFRAVVAALSKTQTFESKSLAPTQIVGALVLVGSKSKVSLSQLAYLQSDSHLPLTSVDRIVEVSKGDDLTQLISEDFLSRALFISGGTTARIFLDIAGITWLRMLNPLDYGIALGVSSNNQMIGIKPGSFGKEDTISKSLTAMLKICTLTNRN